MRFSACLFLWVFFLPSITGAQQPCAFVLTGRVLSNVGAPLMNAEVIMKGQSRGEVTDESGTFTFDKLCPGEYVLEIRYVGYITQVIRVSTSDTKPLLIALEPEIKSLQEVVIEEKVEKVERTSTYSLLDASDLEKSMGKTLGETLRSLPGVTTIQSGPGIFKPVIHGVHSQRVLILNHGLRQEGQQWGAEHAPEIDPFIASNIAVIKDAAAIKYGTDALGGVIIVNPAPLPERSGLGGTLNTIVQSNGRSGTISGMLEGGLKNLPGWGWRVQGTAKRSGDFNAPDYSLTNTGVRELDFSTAAGYHGGKFGVELFFSHFQSELGILRGSAISNLNDLMTAMEQEPPIGTKDFSYTISEPRQEVIHNLLKLNSHWETEKGEWRFQYGYQSNFRKEFDIRRGALSSKPALDLDLRTHTLELEWESSDKANRQFCFGVNGMYQDNRNVPGTQRIPFIPNYTSFSGGPFAVGKFILNQWTLDIGTRYDVRSYSVIGYDYKNTLYTADLLFHNASFSAGISRNVGTHQTVKLHLGSAWRPPHVAELYSLGTHQSAAAIEYGLLLNDSTNEVMDIKDVPFKIEKAFKVVGTYEYDTERLQLDATVYVNSILNYIYLQPRGVTTNVRGTYPYFRYTQTDALFVGMDVAASWTMSTRFSLEPKLSLLSATDVRNNDYLVFIPSNRLEIGLKYKGAKHNFYIEPKVNLVARQNRAPRVITVREFNDAIASGQDPLGGSSKNFDFMEAPPGYLLAGVAVGYSIPSGSGRFDLRFAIENLLNTSYREYTNRLRYYADDIGRNVSLSAKYVF
ncbi:MAG: TonB-dependent receptor [Cyclobacteriaceae bacterium]|nr:TonB-dependent receptor [Cyclobacteriaceae bacterium]